MMGVWPIYDDNDSTTATRVVTMAVMVCGRGGKNREILQGHGYTFTAIDFVTAPLRSSPRLPSSMAATNPSD